MSIFRVFDWISPLVQAVTPGETMMLTPAEMNYLEARGIRVHSESAVGDWTGDLYAVKVDDAKRARELLGR